MSYKSAFQQRYEIGKSSEGEVLPIIKEFFKDNTIEPTINKLDRYDYKSKSKNFELKTRTNKYNDYPTTMIGLDKCEINSILLFKYTDGLYYIEYNEEQFKKYQIKKFTKYVQKKDYIYIPISDLKIIKQTIICNNNICDFLD
jgi:hypothetical protein